MKKTYIAPSIVLEDMGLQSMLSNRLLWGDEEDGF